MTPDESYESAVATALLTDPTERPLPVTLQEAALIYTLCQKAEFSGAADILAARLLTGKTKAMMQTVIRENGLIRKAGGP